MSTARLSFSPQHPFLPIIADIHLHSHHSHGLHSVEAMYEAALARGLSFIGFSEHSPRPKGYAYPKDYQDKLSERLPLYVREVRDMAKRALAHGVTVLLGLEADYIPGRETFAETWSKAYPFDYIIGGLHFQGTWGFDFAASDWEAMDMEARFTAYADYYLDMAAMCQTGLFHVAAHPDLIKLFTIDSFRKWLATTQALPLIKNALTSMKDNGVIMEVSSAGLRKPCCEIYPGPLIMEQAAKLRLPISFASDAHCVNTPAYAFDRLARYAGAFGYSHSVVIVGGRPRPVSFATPPVL